MTSMATPSMQSTPISISSGSSSCRSPPVSIHSVSSENNFQGRRLFEDSESLDQENSKFSVETFADTKKKLSFPSPEVSELVEHLHVLDGLSNWPFSRKHRSTPNTSAKKNTLSLSIQKVAAEIREIEARTDHVDLSSTLENGKFSTKNQWWLFSLGAISLAIICMIIICFLSVNLTSKVSRVN
jgi:hypothetical protein